MSTLAAEAKPYPEVLAGGLRVACISRSDLAQLMVRECLSARESGHAAPKLVLSVNGEVLSLAARNPEIRRCYELADHVHADSQPLVIAARLLARPSIPERSAITDFFHDAAGAARAHGVSFYLLGGTEENNRACAEIMRARHPGLVIAGRRHGYFRPEDETELCAEINRAGADVVWIGLGTRLELDFCARNRHRIRAGWLIGAGGCFNYVSGHYRRAPVWIQRIGFEWLHRLWHEPRRLFWRYAVTNPHALYLLLTRTSALKETHAGLAVGDVRAAGSTG
jgi:N-acetylglucosaminyldiphosphoundecaprenol N-acetyl-beta-D-mannosaminyltransferase